MLLRIWRARDDLKRGTVETRIDHEFQNGITLSVPTEGDINYLVGEGNFQCILFYPPASR